MDAKEIATLRDELMRRKTEEELNAKQRQDVINTVKGIVENLSEEQIALAKRKGFNIEAIINIDYEKLKTDNDYVIAYKELAREAITDYVKGVKTRLNI